MANSVRLALAAMLLAATPAAAKVGSGNANLGVGFGQATGGHVKVFDGRNLLVHDFDPYPGFAGGVRVALGDVNGDGVGDLITGAGVGGGPHVKAFDGVTGAELHSFFAFDAGFTGGVNVSAGDVNGDGRADVVVGAGFGGGPHVKVFSGLDGKELHSFFAFDPGFTGGVTVTAGDINGDGFDDVIVGAGPGAGPHVRIFDSTNGQEIRSFFAFDTGFQGGVSVATGRFDGVDALIVGAGPGGGPHVKVFALSDFSLLDSFFAFDPTFTGGVNVGAGVLNGEDMLFIGMASDGGSALLLPAVQRIREAAARSGEPLLIQPFGDDYRGGITIGGFFPTAVPEPATWLQLLAGFGIAGTLLRRRRRALA